MRLTHKLQYGKKCTDGKRRNFAIYFLNDIEILRIKIPFDTSYDSGHDKVTLFTNEKLIGNRLWITKIRPSKWDFENNVRTYKERQVSYPISQRKLQQALNKN